MSRAGARRPYRDKKAFARVLRNRMTPAERQLWAHIQGDYTGALFRRQYIVCGFIPDFYSIDKRLAIELDGGYHCEQRGYDAWRDRRMAAEKGVFTLRFQNERVFDEIDAVLSEIIAAVATRRPLAHQWWLRIALPGA